MNWERVFLVLTVLMFLALIATLFVGHLPFGDGAR
jgi:hypothetical protein